MGEAPKVLVWGDSFAMALVPGLVDQLAGMGLAQSTKSVCGPTVGVAPVEQVMKWGYGRTWAEGCLSFNDSVIQYLRVTPSIEVVILSSPLRQYIDQAGYGVLIGNGQHSEKAGSVDALMLGLGNTVRAVRALGRKVVLVAPPPNGGYDIRVCLDRRAEGKILIGPFADRVVSTSAYRERNGVIFDAIRRMQVELDLGVVSFDTEMCSGKTCVTELDGVPLYLDAYHLSKKGSVLLARKMKLLSQIEAAAR